MPYVSAKQRRLFHARPELRPIARKWDAEERALKHHRVAKGLKRDVALGLMTGTVGGVAANQLPQNQTPTQEALRRKRKQLKRLRSDYGLSKAERGGGPTGSRPEIEVGGLGAARRERRKSTAQAAGYGAAATATGLAGAGLSAARYAPKSVLDVAERNHRKVTGAVANAASGGPSPAAAKAGKFLHDSNAGQKFVRTARWAKKNPKKAVAGALALKGAAAVSGIASRYRSQEAAGLSHEIGTTQGVRRARREGVRKSASYLYLDPTPTARSGEGGVRTPNPVKPLDLLAASELYHQGAAGSRFKPRKRRQRNLERTYGQQLQLGLGIGRAYQ